MECELYCTPLVIVSDCVCSGPVNKVALRHYMDFFDFTNMRLDNAFR